MYSFYNTNINSLTIEDPTGWSGGSETVTLTGGDSTGSHTKSVNITVVGFTIRAPKGNSNYAPTGTYFPTDVRTLNGSLYYFDLAQKPSLAAKMLSGNVSISAYWHGAGYNTGLSGTYTGTMKHYQYDISK